MSVLLARGYIQLMPTKSLDLHLWRLCIATWTKLCLYNVCILPIMLYGSECQTVNKAEVQRTDALDQWYMQMVISIRWHDFTRNTRVWHITEQPPLSSHNVSHCFGKWLLDMGKQMRTEYCFSSKLSTGEDPQHDCTPSDSRISPTSWRPLTWCCWRQEVLIILKAAFFT